jgi:serine/threonine protein kinase
MLKRGTSLRTHTGQTLQVERLIGEGGQGEVYRVLIEGKPYALKWYHQPATEQQKDLAAEQRAALRDYLLKKQPPDPRFLWPLSLVDHPKRVTFGYVMDLIPEGYQGLEQLVLGRMRPVPRFKTLCTAAIALSECFRKLHNMGACYKDINLGGPLLNPATGDVVVCDTDNVRVNKTPGNIIFVFFAAPELIMGRGICQTNTDIHSLAVLLFYMFVRHHPLEGRRALQVNVFNEAAQRKFYGRQPVFLFDPDDETNRPVPGFHDPALRNWPLYPEFLRRRFTRAFTVGLKRPEMRVREGEWMADFSRLRDSIYRCTHCGMENFLDTDAEETAPCWRCAKASDLPLRLSVDKHTVLLNADTQLFPHHLGSALDFTAPAAEVTQHPTNPSRWGLKNLSRRRWRYTGKSGEEKTVDPGRAVPLRVGLELDFGKTSGSVSR